MRKAKKWSFVIGNKKAGISKVSCIYNGVSIYQTGLYLFPFSIELTLSSRESLQVRIRIWEMCMVAILEKIKWPEQ